MPFRTHIITGEPILFAPERAERPAAFIGDRAPERCPFCPGHEEDTPPPMFTTGDPWRVRVFPNKYPSTEDAEVIVESPRHEDSFDRIEHAEEVVRVYVDRYRAHNRAAYVSLFKNEGPLAGASIPHVHSQVMPLPFLPPRIEREGAAFRTGECPLCAAIDSHRRDGMMIGESESFAWLAPSASWMAWQQWIVPKRHAPEIDHLDMADIRELGRLLRKASAATRHISSSYNWSFINFPSTNFTHEAAAHWYVDLYPRLTTVAGFELATGTFIEIIDPAAAARRLRAFA